MSNGQRMLVSFHGSQDIAREVAVLTWSYVDPPSRKGPRS